MAGAIVFDTYAYVRKLRDAGMPEEQAKVQAEALAELIDERLATKKDLQDLELRLTHALTLRLGGMLVVGITLVAALVKVL